MARDKARSSLIGMRAVGVVVGGLRMQRVESGEIEGLGQPFPRQVFLRDEAVVVA
jgi:hypothetical protein